MRITSTSCAWNPASASRPPRRWRGSDRGWQWWGGREVIAEERAWRADRPGRRWAAPGMAWLAGRPAARRARSGTDRLPVPGAAQGHARTIRTSLAPLTSTTARWRCDAKPPRPLAVNAPYCGCTGESPVTGSGLCVTSSLDHTCRGNHYGTSRWALLMRRLNTCSALSQANSHRARIDATLNTATPLLP